MNIQYVLDNFRNWKDEERKQLAPVLDMLSNVSLKILENFELQWHVDHQDFSGECYEDFVVAQNNVIEACLLLEFSPVGQIIRQELGLEPLARETEVPGNPVVGSSEMLP